MKTKFNFKHRNKSIQGLRLFKDTLPTKAKKIITKKGEVYSKTLDNWKYLVGENLFKFCYPKSFKKSISKSRSLIVMVKHGYEINLEYSKKIIVDKINYFFNNKVIDNIIIKSFDNDNNEKKIKNIKHVTKSKFSEKIFGLKNQELKKSLEEFSKVYKKK